jgi:abnormal spindle-like microcephaly-associated protein
LQSYFRGEFGRSIAKHIRSEHVADRFLAVKSAIKIQHCFREYRQYKKESYAVTMIQRMAKRFLSRRKFDKVRQSIVRAQCLVRGFVVRRKRSKKVIVQARRIGMANKKALTTPNMKLGRRTRDALEVLVHSKSLAEIMDAVCVLEVATRLSEVCCITFAEAKAPDILFFLIQTCNRSLPHLKLLQYILQTLTNVARFDKLVPAMASLSGVEVFLDLLQMFRDKDYVFCLVVSLLERIVRSNFEKVVSFHNATCEHFLPFDSLF